MSVAIAAEPATDAWNRIAVFAPVGRDGQLVCSVLADARIPTILCHDDQELCAIVAEGTGAILVTEEALDEDLSARLRDTFNEQPPWSDLPLLILTGQPLGDAPRPRSFSQLGRRANVTLVDRPVRMKTLVTTAESLLRFRSRQYEIRDLMSKLENRVNERDRFLAILGHELRNPLGAILMATQMGNEDGRLEPEHVDRIERQSRHLSRLVNDLLDLSRVTSGKIVLRRARVNLLDVVRQCIQTVQAIADTQRLELTMECPHDTVLVDGDPTRLDQIISNVLTNSMKYTPAGGKVHVLVDCDDHSATVIIRDTGVGISPDRIDTIFELFTQAENAVGRSQGGMGIGLALVKNLVELHGGRVTAQSSGEGKGSEFRISLPLARGPAAVAKGPADKPVNARAERAVRRVVVIEDNPDVRDLLTLKLKRLGQDVVGEAGDGQQGLALVLETRPAIAFVDIGLPGLDGYDVARSVRKQLGEEIVLVALSGFGQPDDKRRALESGFDLHITKPAEVNEIEAILEAG